MQTVFSTFGAALGRVSLAAALVAGAGLAHADIVYDSLSGVTPSLVANPSTGAGLYYYQSQNFAAYTDPIFGGSSEAVTSIGDLVELTTNTGRAITSVSLGLVKAANTAATSFSVTVSFFDTAKNLFAVLDSGTLTLPAVGTLNSAANASQFNLTLPASGASQFNLNDSFYYLVSVSSATPGLGVLLYDYYHDTGLVGTDVGTSQDSNGDWSSTVYGTTGGSATITSALGAYNDSVLSTGFTPAIQFNVATPTANVPEPSSYGLLGLGLFALAGVSQLNRRRRG